MDYKAYYKQAKEAYNAGNYVEAIRLWTLAIEAFPKEGEEAYDAKKNAGLYYNRGLTYQYLKKHNEALADYNEAIKLNPKFAEAYNNRGNVYQELKEYKQALADYDKAIKLNSNNAEAYNNRGTVYARLEKYTEAIKDFKKVIKLNPNDAKGYYGLALLYEELGETVLASYNYTKMFRVLQGYSDLEAHHKIDRKEETISIFKFSPFNENTLKTLINSKLFLSQPHKHWNDPHDCNMDVWGAMAQNLFREKARLQAFMIEKEGKKPYENTLLWAHYADSHKGICIEYEYTLNRENPIATLHKVKYQSEIAFNELSDGFRIKAEDWQYENEVRLFYFDDNKEDPNVLKSFDELGLKIKAVYFGTRCSPDNQETIKKILGNDDIVFDMIKQERSFVLKLKEM